ncbi:unnamed protein product [Diatraea saccharalis]|uniref:C2 domain-containing protein n=1 Tax=Diatraea saccharalis TaxID=40085 RepID=A0A9N9N5C4_9NEOP|nr:unnamed protein product [Diatraea saccharalis]
MENENNNNCLSDSDKVVENNVSENEQNNGDAPKIKRHSSVSSDSSSATEKRSRISNLFRSSVRSKKSKNPQSVATSNGDYDKAIVPVTEKKSPLFTHKDWTTIVSVVLVEAKGLPVPPTDGTSHKLYCKLRLGTESMKSKYVPNTPHPEWKEWFQLRLHKDNLLKLSLWDKGKQKNFMGSTVLDLTHLERDRTHEVWQQLDDGFGTVHFSVTLCNVKDNSATESDDASLTEGVIRTKHAIHNLKSNWKLVGQLYVKVIGARGLSGKPHAYCTLELDNERVQTHSTSSSSEPVWNKSYVFNVYDVTSTLDLKVYDSSLVMALRSDSLGRVSIPLLKIQNGEPTWFALKDRTKRHSARGNCPRVQLEMTMFWNPVKATVRLFQPQEVKYLKKPPKFDIPLVYSNMEFIRDTFHALFEINEQYKRLFEWENRELSFTVLVCWLVFWYYFRLWATPLLLLLPFVYFWISQTQQTEWPITRSVNVVEDNPDQHDDDKSEKGLTGRIMGLQEMTLTITGGVEYSVSLVERVHNLARFKVPFLSYLTMILLVVSSIGFYLIPFNYMMMAFGIYKFTRKYLNPNRTLNNDLLDFITRVPDNEILKDWKELNVPEPSVKRQPVTQGQLSISDR